MADEENESGLSAPQAGATPPQVVTESWTMLASTGGLTMAQSAIEYAVYDGATSYGRWPLTEEGHRYATQTYQAHAQSLAHGVAFTATGYQDPSRLGLPTEAAIKSQTYAAPLSYVGSTRRIVAWANKTSERSPSLKVLVWIAAALAMIFMWSFLATWYLITFGIFGIFVIPYRLVRRSQRKALHVQQTTLATQQAMLQHMASQQQPAYQPATHQVQTGVQLPAPPPPQIGDGPPSA